MMIKSRRTAGSGIRSTHGSYENEYKILVRKPERKIPLGDKVLKRRK
jgi:hypothetical protein